MRWSHLFAGLVLVAQVAASEAEVSFSRQIAPLLQMKCLPCHSAEKARGGYRVHTFSALFQPGKSKSASLVAENPSASELFKRITAADEDERMPQKDDPLSAAQIQLFRSWIAAGAKLDAGNSEAPISSLIPASAHEAPPNVYRRPVPILALAFTPEGQLAASGYREITVWNMHAELTRRITNVMPRVRALAFEPAGKLLAVAGGQPGRAGELTMYDYSSGQLKTNLLRTSDELICLAFSADGKRLACGGTDNAIHLFDTETSQPLITIQQHADWVTALSFATAGEQIASASRDRTARVYNTISGNLETTYTGQNTPLYAVAFLQNGDVVSGGRDKTIHLWDPLEGKKKADFGAFDGEINALVGTADYVFEGSSDGVVKQYTIADRQPIHSFAGDGGAIYSLAYHAPSHRLASGGYDGVVNLWNTESGALEKSFFAAPGWESKR